MNIQITSLTEEQVNTVAVILDDAGFRYEEDYEVLYTGPWVPCGLSIYGRRALEVQARVAQVLKAA